MGVPKTVEATLVEDTLRQKKHKTHCSLISSEQKAINLHYLY